jgi:uncharacterized protein YjbJ (UPF0337 family)
MDKDRIKSSSTQAMGVVKELAGKALGDAKLTAAERIGGLKDALKKK